MSIPAALREQTLLSVLNSWSMLYFFHLIKFNTRLAQTHKHLSFFDFYSTNPTHDPSTAPSAPYAG